MRCLSPEGEEHPSSFPRPGLKRSWRSAGTRGERGSCAIRAWTGGTRRRTVSRGWRLLRLEIVGRPPGAVGEARGLWVGTVRGVGEIDGHGGCAGQRDETDEGMGVAAGGGDWRGTHAEADSYLLQPFVDVSAFGADRRPAVDGPHLGECRAADGVNDQRQTGELRPV